MSELVYLELEEVVEIYAQLLDLYGGRPGFKDRGGVESALFRPRQKAHDEGADLLSQAASLYFGLAKNHGFIDGSKRIAVVATDAFLQLNEWELRCDNATLAGFTLRCDEAGWTEDLVEEFVRRQAVPLALERHHQQDI